MKKTKLFTLIPLLLVGGLAACNNGGTSSEVSSLKPSKTDVGLLYCSAESNSLYQVNKVKETLESDGFTTRLISFVDSNDIATVLNGSIGNVSTLYIPTDNTCASNGDIINTIAREKGVPVFAGEEGLCKKCGAITLSISYYNIGVETGKMAVDILLGEKDISTMPIAYDANPVKKYNEDFCNALNITVPSDYVKIGESSESSPDLGTFKNNDNRHFNIGVSQFVTHEALDAATQGFIDAVNRGLGEDNVSFNKQNAAGQTELCVTIANNFVSHNVDLILANATPCLQAAANSTLNIPILGTSITEYGTALNIPDFHGVVGGNISGTSDLAPLETQAKMLETVFAPFFGK